MLNPQLLPRVRASLGDAICWAGRRATQAPSSETDIPRCLRSAELHATAARIQPSLRSALAGPDGLTLTDGFSTLLRERHAKLPLKTPRTSLMRIEEELTRPRALLVVDWQREPTEASWVERQSQGYLDRHSLPPWDTWLELFPTQHPHGARLCLLSWIPPWASTLVEDALCSAPDARLTWAELTQGTLKLRPWGENWSRDPAR